MYLKQIEWKIILNFYNNHVCWLALVRLWQFKRLMFKKKIVGGQTLHISTNLGKNVQGKRMLPFSSDMPPRKRLLNP